jgi:hypothetical protein
MRSEGALLKERSMEACAGALDRAVAAVPALVRWRRRTEWKRLLLRERPSKRHHRGR